MAKNKYAEMAAALEEKRRLEEMQGPEQHLVGDVAERIPQRGDVEEAQPGKRGVEEIGGAVELRGYIERKMKEAREESFAADRAEDDDEMRFQQGKGKALVELLEWLTDRTGQRSDLFNDQGVSVG